MSGNAESRYIQMVLMLSLPAAFIAGHSDAVAGRLPDV
jgi:hypothetical protein